MNALTIRVRSVLRRLGLTRYLRPGRLFLDAYYRQLFRIGTPEEITVGFGDLRAKMAVRSASEYAVLRGKREDASFMGLLARRLGPGDCFWDVGSNVGYYAVLAAKVVGPSGVVVAFEPEPGSRERLRDNVTRNGLSNVRIVEHALGSAEGEFTLEANAEPLSGSHRLSLGRADRIEGSRRIVVQVARGDDVSTELPRPNGVKIDVEGAELEVVEGMSRTLLAPECRALLCEVHFGQLEERGMPLAPRTLEARIRELGFQDLRWVDPSHIFAVK